MLWKDTTTKDQDYVKKSFQMTKKTTNNPTEKKKMGKAYEQEIHRKFKWPIQ